MKQYEKVDFYNQPIITTYAKRANESYRGFFHYHEGIELLFVHEGSGKIKINQKSYLIRPNSLYIFQPFQLHQVMVHTPDDYVRSMFLFDPNYVEKKLEAFPILKRFTSLLWKGRLSEHCYQDFNFFAAMTLNIHHTKQKTKQTEEDAFILLLQVLNNLQYELNISDSLTPQRTQPHVEKMLDWIEQHYQEDFKLQHIADDLHLSKYYVSHLFKEHTGYAITEYLMARRLKEACLLLVNTDNSIEHIGQTVGIPDASYFTKFFKKRMGVTPKKYRELNLEPFHRDSFF
ncbi:helix-turn-helix domain-containing protein [Halalkalibacterium halodurans]|uniref:helix-turn-helix domain-containing protein n=1 Tax=Halalkalibacterium halodurans TaxID=86665 RepID=UPI002AA9E249|nr:AraC family transcriptional regulator [Halalkalibacterium halodurans]MDY7223324.1 AraC family transcriptional regulator [Halalkalibacterium halodurans]MDY7242545.1 AraC family transcriptional regulator [Halalkalibacterium halodurans]